MLFLRDTHFPHDRCLVHKEISLVTGGNSQCDLGIQFKILLVEETQYFVTNLSRVLERLATITCRRVNCEGLVAESHGD